MPSCEPLVIRLAPSRARACSVHMITHLKTRRMRPSVFAPHSTTALLDNYIAAAQMLTDNTSRAEWDEVSFFPVSFRLSLAPCGCYGVPRLIS